jgi:hypothetical protein
MRLVVESGRAAIAKEGSDIGKPNETDWDMRPGFTLLTISKAHGHATEWLSVAIDVIVARRF